MRSLLIPLLLCTIAGSATSCDKFQKYMEMFCKVPGETNTCLTDNAYTYQSSCCASKGGCNSREFPKDKVCCFTQECLNRCYPGKDHRLGKVY